MTSSTPIQQAHAAVRKRGAQRRGAILDAAMALYADSGFSGTGLTAIGERAGVSHSAVLYHFGSAKQLLLAVLQERDRRQGPVFEDLFRDGGLAALARLPEVARVNEAAPGYAKLFTVLEVEHLDGDPDVQRYFVRRARRLRRFVVKLIEDGQRCGEIRADVCPKTRSNEIMAFMEGAQLLRFQDPTRVDLVAVYEGYTRSLIESLAA